MIAFLRKQDHGYINRIIEDNPNLNIQKINDQFILVNQTKQLQQQTQDLSKQQQALTTQNQNLKANLQTQTAKIQTKEMLFQILPDIAKQSYSTEVSLKNGILKKWKSAIDKIEDPILKPLMIDFVTKKTPKIKKWIEEIGWKFFTINKQWNLKTTSQYHEEKLQQQKQKWSKRKQDLITERQNVRANLQTQTAKIRTKEMLFQILPDISKGYSTKELLKEDILKKWKLAIDKIEDPILKPLMTDFVTKKTPKIKKWMTEFGWNYFHIKEQWYLKNASQYHQEKARKLAKNNDDLNKKLAGFSNEDRTTIKQNLLTPNTKPEVIEKRAKTILFNILPDIAKGYSTKALFKPDILTKWKLEINKIEHPALKPLMINFTINAKFDQIKKWIKEIGWKFSKINKKWYLKHTTQYYQKRAKELYRQYQQMFKNLKGWSALNLIFDEELKTATQNWKKSEKQITKITENQAKKILFKILPDIAKQSYPTKVSLENGILTKWKSAIDKTDDQIENPILKPLMIDFATKTKSQKIAKWIKKFGLDFVQEENTQWYLQDAKAKIGKTASYET